MAAKRTTRARKINAPDEGEISAAGDVVQAAIDRMGESADAVPSGNQMDNTNIQNEVNSTPPPDPFAEQYEKAKARGITHLRRVRSSVGQSTLIPPKCEIHPKLGRWALNRSGRWLVIRWVGIKQQQRQRRFEQGYQYFEGREQILDLGLDPEVYMNDRGRVQIGDAELAWVPEEFVFEHLRETEERKDAMVATAKDRVYNNIGEFVPDVRVFEGTEGEVMDQLSSLRRPS